VILGVLSLIDLCFTGNLIVIVIFSGFENFVSRIDAGDHRPVSRVVANRRARRPAVGADPASERAAEQNHLTLARLRLPRRLD
jgi:Uncharacterized protein family, UPF0114